MADTPEGKVKKAIVKWLLSNGFWKAGAAPPEAVHGWFYMPVSNGMGVAGIPDFVGCFRGRFFSIEAKAANGKPTENQLKRHQEIKTAGGVIHIVSDVSQLSSVLDSL